MAAEPQREITPPLPSDNHPSYFLGTKARLIDILGENTEHPLLTRFYMYYKNTVQNMQKLSEETPKQHEKHMNWATQAAAIELLSAYGFKKNEGRITWKTALTQEILEERDAAPNSDLPGINVSFYRFPDSDLDAYSGNRIIINFDGIHTAYPGSKLDLHVAGDYQELFQRMDSIVLNNQIQHAKEEDITPVVWAEMLLGEIRMIQGKLRNVEEDRITLPEEEKNLIKAIRRRYEALCALIEEDEANQLGITVRYVETTVENKVYRAFSIEPAGMQVQPEEVTDDIWNSLKERCVREHDGLIIPSREGAKQPSIQRSSRRNRHQKREEPEEDDRWT